MAKPDRAKGKLPTRLLKWLSVLGSLLLIVPSPTAEARPIYKSVFEEVYRKSYRNAKIECAICHQPKGAQTCYSGALAKELGETKVSDRAKIAEAMHAIEKGECKCGQWGKRISEGKAPCNYCKGCSESAFEGPVRDRVPGTATKKPKTGS